MHSTSERLVHLATTRACVLDNKVLKLVVGLEEVTKNTTLSDASVILALVTRHMVGDISDNEEHGTCGP